MKKLAKIVILDGYPINPGDLTWEGLSTLGELTVYERTAVEEILERAEGAEIILTNKVPLTKQLLEKLSSLKYIGVLATGYNIVDIEAAKEHGITVSHIPAYSTQAVAQMTIALLLELCVRVGDHNRAVKRGEWSSCPDFTFRLSPLTELAGRTMGIIGWGRIGGKVGEIAHALGMKVLAHSRTRKNRPRFNSFSWADRDFLLREADVVSLHCPQTESTLGMINTRALSLMKKSALLINTSRGGLVKDEDLAQALDSGLLAGAALDVLSAYEPPRADNPLLKAKNCIITPHIGWSTLEARKRLIKIAYDNLKSYLQGKPQNLV